MSPLSQILAFLLILAINSTIGTKSDHTMDPEQGMLLFPMPKRISNGSMMIDIENPCSFKFELESKPDDLATQKIYEEIFEFYNGKIFRRALEFCERKNVYTNKTSHKVDHLTISIENLKVTPPTHGVDESYTLNLQTDTFTLHAKTYVGFLRGLETFSQLVYYDEVSQETPWYYVPKVPVIVTDDAPIHKIRGITLDVTVNYISKRALFKVIDGLMFSKMNTLHLILASDHSFPLQLKELKNITFHGAFSEEERYTPEDIAELVDYATSRGVRIMPHINVPGFARWLLLDPENQKNQLLGCKVATETGMDTMVLNPLIDKTYEVLVSIFKDITSMFKDEFIYIGSIGDDKIRNCFMQNDIVNLKTKLEINGDLQTYFFDQLIQKIAPFTKGKTLVIWVDQGSPLELSASTNDVSIAYHVVDDSLATQFTSRKLKVISSKKDYNLGCAMGNWKGDVGCPFKGWISFGQLNPIPTGSEYYMGFTSMAKGDLINDQTVEFYLWPKAAAVAERLWRNESAGSLWRRVGGLEVRYNERGIGCQPLACEWCQRHINECLGGM